jgi:RNA polymerase sigma-70 factor (ECF subfamily)
MSSSAADRSSKIFRRDSGGDDDDAPLVAAVAAGNREAFATLYDLYAPRVYGMALRVLGRDADAEAVVSDVFLSLWKDPKGFDPSRGPFRTYVLLLARSRSIDRLRAGATRAERTEAAVAESLPGMTERQHSDRPDALLVERENKDQIRSAVGRLDAKQRTPLEMAYFQGLTHVEIAEQLGEPLGTIKTRIRTALQTLRSALRSLGGDHDDV